MSSKTLKLSSLKLIIARLMIGLTIATITTICFLIWSDYSALTKIFIFIGTTALSFHLVFPVLHIYAKIVAWLECNVPYFQMKSFYRKYPEVKAMYQNGKKNKFDFWTQ